MKKDRLTSVSDFIPDFDLANRFCYFLDLNNVENNHGSLAAQKINVFYSAVSDLIIPFKNAAQIKNGRTTEDIENAIKFLKNIAQSEREKEMRVLYRYKKELEKSPIVQDLIAKDTNTYSNINDIFSDMEKFLNNPSGDPHDFYIQLTTLLNAARQTAESYRMRLAQLADKTRASTREIRSDFMLARMTSDLKTLLATSIGTLRRKDERSMSSKISDLVINYVTDNYKNNPAFLNNPYEVLAGTLMDFEAFLQAEYDKMNNRGEKIENLDINKIFKQFTQANTRFTQLLQQDSAELNELLLDIRSTLGIKRLTKASKQYETYQGQLEKNLASKTGEKRLRGMQKIQGIFNAVGRKAPIVQWSLEGNKHGSIAELLRPLLEEGAKHIGSHGTAADVITTKLYQLRLKFPEDAAWIAEQEKEIIKLIEGMGIEERENAMDDLTDVYGKVNKQIEAVDKQLLDFLEQRGIQEDIFIYHESLKLYLQAEQGITKDFHGRELQIMSLLDILYSANNIGGLSLIEEDIMRGIATNLAKGAIGDSSKGAVEKYLSIFAGLLMFDDVKNIAQDIARTALTNIQQNDVFHIHLYLINQIYIPSSLLLSQIVFALQKGYEQMNFEDARITISTGGMSESIQYYVDTRQDKDGNTVSLQMWKDYREQAAQETTARIAFLRSFLDLVASLQEYIQS